MLKMLLEIKNNINYKLILQEQKYKIEIKKLKDFIVNAVILLVYLIIIYKDIITDLNTNNNN